MKYSQIRVYKATNSKLRKIAKSKGKTAIVLIDDMANAEINKMHNW